MNDDRQPTHTQPPPATQWQPGSPWQPDGQRQHGPAWPDGRTQPIDLGAAPPWDATSPEIGSHRASGRHGKRRLTIIATVTAVLVAGVGVGAYAGVRAWTGSGIDEPETAVPAATAAFLRVDLKPGYRDQIAFDGLAKKFPSGAESTSDLVIDLERKMLRDTDLDFDTDVKPWFGQRAGIGAYALDTRHVITLVALASTDDVKAEQVLAKERAHGGDESFGYVVHDGYALLAVGGDDVDLQAAAQRASQAAASKSLADDGAFHSTVSHLDGHNILLGYANLAKVAPLLGDVPGFGSPANPSFGWGGPSAGMLKGFTPLSMGSLSDMKGTVAIGAAAVDDGVEIRAHVEGVSDAGKRPAADALSALEDMPSAAVVAAAFQGLDPDGDAIKQVDAMLGGLAGLTSHGDGGGAAIGTMSGVITQVLTAKLLTFEFSGVTAGKPNLVIGVDVGDQGKAKSLAQSAGAIPGMVITQDGTTVRATAGEAPGGGALGDSALFQTAMKGGQGAPIAVYVDVQKLLALAGPDAMSGRMAQMLAPVKAIGVMAGSQGTSSDELIRVIIK